MDREGVGHIGLAYYGTADPAYYGIDYTPLPAARGGMQLPSIARPWQKPALPGYVAVGATVLTGVYHEPRWQMFYRGLHDVTPAAVIGNSIFVYWLDRWPEADDAFPQTTAAAIEADRRLGDDLLRAQWFEHAAVHYGRYLERRPDDAAALMNLGVALASTEDTEEAIAVLRRAIAVAPGSGGSHLMLAAALFDTRGDLGEIVAHARRAASLLPSDPDPLVLLGRALATSGQLGEAVTAVNQALAIDPAHADAGELLRIIRSVTPSS
jgi:tetratricopeptide (TPR) repeat protein